MSFHMYNYNFYIDGCMVIPEIKPYDKSSINLVSLIFGTDDVFAFYSDVMIESFNEDDKTLHPIGNKQMIIPDMPAHSFRYLECYLASREDIPNGYRTNKANWMLVHSELKELLQSTRNHFEREMDMMQTKVKQVEDRNVKFAEYKQAAQELNQVRLALRETKRIIKQEKQDAREVADTKGYVYLLRVINTDNLYKIGRASNPDKRLKTFHSKLPFQVEYEHLISTDDMYALEGELHWHFNSKRQNGSEFFTLTPEDVAYIKSIAQE